MDRLPKSNNLIQVQSKYILLIYYSTTQRERGWSVRKKKLDGLGIIYILKKFVCPCNLSVTISYPTYTSPRIKYVCMLEYMWYNSIPITVEFCITVTVSDFYLQSI